MLKKGKQLDSNGVKSVYAARLLGGDVTGQGRKIGIVVSRWNSEITVPLFDAAIHTLRSAGVAELDIVCIEVPGAFEIPFALNELATKGTLHGLVALGSVIKGETAHFEYISESVMSGIREVMLEHRMPIGCGVLTTFTHEQAVARAGADSENKGIEAALATLEMVSLQEKLAIDDIFTLNQ